MLIDNDASNLTASGGASGGGNTASTKPPKSRRQAGGHAPESDIHMFVRLLTTQLARAPLAEVHRFLLNIGLNMPQAARAIPRDPKDQSTGLCRTHSSLRNTGDVLLAVYVKLAKSLFDIIVKKRRCCGTI